MNGPLPITYSEIKAWKELTNDPINSRDIVTLKKLDRIYLEEANG